MCWSEQLNSSGRLRTNTSLVCHTSCEYTRGLVLDTHSTSAPFHLSWVTLGIFDGVGGERLWQDPHFRLLNKHKLVCIVLLSLCFCSRTMTLASSQFGRIRETSFMSRLYGSRQRTLYGRGWVRSVFLSSSSYFYL